MRDDRNASPPENYFGEGVAERYDEAPPRCSIRTWSSPPSTSSQAWLARGLRSNGIGTGRIALPLARRGIRVHGIELSEAMVGQLHAKPGGDEIDVTIGDFATATVGERFPVAYLVFNTINNLTTQDAQVACFQNVAGHLEPGGCFVVEVRVPSLRRLPYGETFNAFALSETYVGINEYDVANQGLVSHQLHGGQWRDIREALDSRRYVWPSELDLMARLAGMTLRERWSGWQREPFTSESTRHVSVWEKPASPSQD